MTAEKITGLETDEVLGRVYRASTNIDYQPLPAQDLSYFRNLGIRMFLETRNSSTFRGIWLFLSVICISDNLFL